MLKKDSGAKLIEKNNSSPTGMEQFGDKFISTLIDHL
jgi:hypothetical protein